MEGATASDRLDAAASRPSPAWMGWRLRLLFGWALLGCVGLFVALRMVALAPSLDAVWESDPQGAVRLAASGDPALAPYLGRELVAVRGGGDSVPADEALVDRQAPRWIVDDDKRERRLSTVSRLEHAFAAPDLRLVFRDGETASPRPGSRGLAGLPLVVWLLAGLGYALGLVAMIVLLAHPCGRNIVYAVMTLAQSANLLLVALGFALPFGPTPEFGQRTWPLPLVLDWITAAAMMHAACLHPRRLAGAAAIATAAWFGATLLIALALGGALPNLWSWGQLSIGVYGLVTIALFSWSHRRKAHPFAIALRRFGIVLLGSWVVLSLAVLQVESSDDLHRLATTGPVVWYLFLASLLLLVPFLARSQDFMREFALLAMISTVATSLDLLFVVVFSLGQFASLALALFASLAVYSGVRQWILNRLLGASIQTTEQMFEQLYRTAREVEAQADRGPALFGRLLGNLFEPLEVQTTDERAVQARIGGGGSSLRVPIPALDANAAAPAGSLVLRYAARGRRLFSDDDARLADRIVEQLRRAVHFDRAVEHGRTEERLRLAQDLHDDIGARLLTLIYTAETQQTADYVRHTLQDLKTLTRGLAASTHRLSDTAAEWKADVHQRTSLAGIALDWRCTFDDDVPLTVVQWSALTRILRELVTNTIAHSGARRLAIALRLEDGAFSLELADDGQGGDPAAWAHGLGLSGIRKRVMQLGGTVRWRPAAPTGVACDVRIPGLSSARPA